MDLKPEGELKDCASVDSITELQARLFPLLPKMTGFFANFILKPPETEVTDDADDGTRSRASSTNLASFTKEPNFQIQPARWPIECQVLSDTVHHDYLRLPAHPEPYYVPTGFEIQPKPSGEEYGEIVYQYTPISPVNYFNRSSVGGSKYLLTTDLAEDEESLKFESRFESGNLATAIKLTPSYYELHLRSDLYTNRHMQWFYFRVTNMRKNFLYRFSIVNFTKDGSLYNSGLKPLMYSDKDNRLNAVGWRRCGDQITYFCNDNVNENCRTDEGEKEEAMMTYSLTFTVMFPYDGDTVYFASCYPYTYTHLQNYLGELTNDPVKSTYTTVRLMCKSIAGNSVDYITITSPPEENETRKKTAIVLTARVHPGETPSSWMMKGMIDYLTSDCESAKELRDKFVFKIVPMLNPDGVIVGNNRCSLAARDLNRQYRTVIREMYPPIWYTKLMVKRLIEECGVTLYCDLHGHSRKNNIFLYGCEDKKRSDRRLMEQIFPLMLHKNSAEKFSFEDCCFKVQKKKEGTGRIVMWLSGITNSYTLEASFAGSSLGSRASTHFSILDYEQMGKAFCQTLLDYYDEEPRKTWLRLKILNRLQVHGSSAERPVNIELSDYSSDDGSSSSYDAEIEAYTKLIVPPPSPVGRKVQTSVPSGTRKKRSQHLHKPIATKHNLADRKTAPVIRTSLTLPIAQPKCGYVSDTSSDSEPEPEVPIRKPIVYKRKQRKQKKPGRKKEQVETKDATQNKSISAVDLVAPSDLNIHQKRSLTTIPSYKSLSSDKKSDLDVDEQLDIIQQKLMALKYRIWYGCDDGEKPLSWDSVTNFASENSIASKSDKKFLIKKRTKTHRKASAKVGNVNVGRKVSAKKSTNNLKRQQAIDVQAPPAPIKQIVVRKSKSFNETTNRPKTGTKLKSYASCDDKENLKAEEKKKSQLKTVAKTGMKPFKV